jgi:formylglycine-generating enzyme required for sulfatase activity
VLGAVVAAAAFGLLLTADDGKAPVPGDAGVRGAYASGLGTGTTWSNIAPEQLAEAERLGIPAMFMDGRGVRFVLIPGGTHTIGSQGATGSSDDLPVREVSLPPFYMSTTEVTNEQFARFVAATDRKTTAEERGSGYVFRPLQNEGDSLDGAHWRRPLSDGVTPEDWFQHPVVQVSWSDAAAYCAWGGYALPTEAQFERGLRAGAWQAVFPWGDQPTPPLGFANYAGEESRRAAPQNSYLGLIPGYDDHHLTTAPVGSFPANRYGLFDMSGNVWEWCADPYAEGSVGPAKPCIAEPRPRSSGVCRVLRGSGWEGNAGDARSSVHSAAVETSYSSNSSGFRVTMALPESTPRLEGAADPSPDR